MVIPRRHELTDEEWALLEPLLPPPRGHGRPYRSPPDPQRHSLRPAHGRPLARSAGALRPLADGLQSPASLDRAGPLGAAPQPAPGPPGRGGPHRLDPPLVHRRLGRPGP